MTRTKNGLDLLHEILRSRAIKPAFQPVVNLDDGVVTECSGEHSTCEIESHCGVRGNWRHINDVVADALRGISLAQMRGAPGKRKGIPLQLAGT